jgi:hypothetical protein
MSTATPKIAVKKAKIVREFTVPGVERVHGVTYDGIRAFSITRPDRWHGEPL